MNVVLEVVYYKGLPTSSPINMRFDETGGTIGRENAREIGRDETKHLLLPDPDQFVSRLHAVISFGNGRFIFNDKSSRGSKLIRENLELINGCSAHLEDNDRLLIGKIKGSEFIYELQIHIETKSKQEIECRTKNADSPNNNLGWLYEPNNRADPKKSLDETGLQSSIHLKHEPPLTFNSADSNSELDWLKWGDEQQAALNTNNEGVSNSPLFGSDKINSQKISNLANNFSDNLSESFANSLSPQKISSSVESIFNSFDFHESQELSPSSVSPLLEDKPLVIAQMRPTPDVVVSSVKPEPNTDLFKCFLEGVGLDLPPDVTDEEQADAMKAFGFVFRHTIDGIMAMLQVRNAVKSEIRSTVTLLNTEKNNPLKFLPNSEAAINAMVYKKYRRMGFIEPGPAIQEAFLDLSDHEFAMRAAFKASLHEILKKFDPIAFGETLEAGSVFQSRNAKCWEAYCAAYPDMVSEAAEGLLKGVFVRAYEDQIRELNDKKFKN